MAVHAPRTPAQPAQLPSVAAGLPFRRMTLGERAADAVARFVFFVLLFPALALYPFVRHRNKVRAVSSPERQGASITALMVLHVRSKMQILGLRPDAGARKLHEVGPLASPAAEFLERFMNAHKLACMWASSLAGLHIGPDQSVAYFTRYEIVRGRLRFFDAVLEYMRPVGQLVVMGAGYDTRAVNGNALGGAHVVYEVDKPETQKQKLALLGKAHLRNAVRTHYVSCNFNEESPWTKLEQSGFDRTQPFVVTWEGVTYYLPELVVADFLKRAAAQMSGNAQACLVLDYFFDDARESMARFARTVKALNEEWLSYYPRDFEQWLRKHDIPLRVHDKVHMQYGGLVMLVPVD